MKNFAVHQTRVIRKAGATPEGRAWHSFDPTVPLPNEVTRCAFAIRDTTPSRNTVADRADVDAELRDLIAALALPAP